MMTSVPPALILELGLESLRRCRGHFVALLSLIVSLTSLTAQVTPAGQSGARQPITGGVNPKVLFNDDRGRFEPERSLSFMTVVLKRSPEQEGELDRLLQSQQDPLSPNYHRWLTPEDFGERFGISQASLDQIQAWMSSEGLTVESTARGRGWIVFGGTAAQVEKAFRTEVHRYEIRGEMHFAAAVAPTVPMALGHLVRSIRGLDDLYWQPPQHPATMDAVAVTRMLIPGDFATIYGFGQTNVLTRGQGQKIVVAGQSAINLADIRQFRSVFRMPDNVPDPILVGRDPGFDRSGSMQQAEAEVQWAGAAAPEATVIYVYSQDVRLAIQTAIDRNLAPVITSGYAVCESDVANADVAALQDLARQANAQGITWIAPSGDTGPAACSGNSYPVSGGLGVSLPAALPEVTGIGGTEFNEAATDATYWAEKGNFSDFSTALRYIPETAWNKSSAVWRARASGGGASKLFPKPAWQTGPGVPGNDARNVPDLSFNASSDHDAYEAFYDGLPSAFGGTSLSSALFAGMLALLNQTVASEDGGPPGMGNINPSLYALARRDTAEFHDVTTGDNNVQCVSSTADCATGSFGFRAGPGYDQATGLGSLWVGAFLGNFRLATSTTLRVSATQVTEGQQVTLTAIVNATDPGGAARRSSLTGYVDFLLDSGALSRDIGFQIPVDSSGAATTTVAVAPGVWFPGTFNIWAQYRGDHHYIASNSNVPITVLPLPPATPILGWPPNQASGVSISVQLVFSSYEATAYDVYFGTTSPPPFWGSVPGVYTLPGGLVTNTKYFWKVIARNISGSAESPVFSFTTTNQPVYTISTLAGTGAYGFSGDDGPATRAKLASPYDVALDRNGNVYIADLANNRIRMVAPTGVISTVVGSGGTANSGDGGPAIAAGLNTPNGIAVDSRGNLYITSGNRIRKVSPNGSISTLAGNDTAGYAGDGGPAAGAQLNYPSAIATDAADNLYVADTGNRCVRKISNGTISTIARSVDAWGIAVDTAGDLYVAGNRRISKVSDGIITTLAGGGAASAASFLDQPALAVSLQNPTRVAVDVEGSLLFTDSGSTREQNRVYRITNGLLTLVAGDASGNSSDLRDGLPATAALLGIPMGIAVSPGGSIYFADFNLSRVLVLNPAGPPAPPSISPGGVLNAASLAPAPVAPGSIATVFGTFKLISPAQALSVPLPGVLAGYSIQFQSGGVITAPLYYASAGQANIQIPWELAGQSAVLMSAVLNGIRGPSLILELTPFAPAIFAMNGQGTGQGAVVDSSYRVVDSSNPATVGSVIQIYCTGLGAVSNPPHTGSAATSTILSQTTTNPTVKIGATEAEVLFSGLAPGSVGEYQINARIPAGVASGSAIPLAVSIGGSTSNTVTIAVR